MTPALVFCLCALLPACAPKAAESTSGTLIYGRGKDAVTLDPARIEDGESAKVTVNLFDTLVRFARDSVAIEPGLAESWTVSEDRLTYVFQLRDGVRFHDGDPLDAEAAAYSLRRLAFEDAPGAPASRPYSYMMESVESIEATGERELTIRLAEPSAPFLRSLAMFCCGIVSPRAVEAAGPAFGEHPVGTGPYRFRSWSRSVAITLDAWEDHWEAAPTIPRVIFRPIPENSVRVDSLIRGDIHILDGIGAAEIPRLRDSGVTLLSRPGMNVGYCGFSCQKAPFDDVRVRLAAAHAVNRAAICEYLFEGIARPAQGVLPPMLPGYDPERRAPDYNPDRARELLAEAGYPEGFATEIYTYTNPRPYNPIGSRLAEAIQGDLRAVGIEAAIVRMEWGAYLETVRHNEPPMFLLGWIGDNGDPDNFLYPLLVADQNHARYRNDAFRALLIEARREADEPRRALLYREAEDRAVADSPWIFLNHCDQILAARSVVTGLEPHPTGLSRLDRVSFGETGPRGHQD